MSKLLVNTLVGNQYWFVCFAYILAILAQNIAPTLGCLHFANSAPILARNILPFHCQYFQCKANF